MSEGKVPQRPADQLNNLQACSSQRVRWAWAGRTREEKTMSKQSLKTAIRDHQKRTGVNYTTARREVLSQEHDTSPAPFISQAASSTDPAVLQAIEDLDLLERYFFHLRAEFVERVTGDVRFYASKSAFSSSRTPRLLAVEAEEKPKGEFWKQGPRGRGWMPAANSKMEQEFEALNDIPHVSMPGADAVQGILLGHYIVTPSIFALDGRAWLRFGSDPEGHPDLQERERLGINWVRERNSDAIRAIEDWNERFAKRRLLPLEDAERERVEVLFEAERRRQEERRKENERFWAERMTKQETAESSH